MANPKYACPIPGCSETRASHHFVTHFLSHDKEDIVKHFGDKVTLASTGALLRVRTKVSGFDKNLQICLGCNKLYARFGLQVAHNQICQNKIKHKFVCNQLLKKSPAPPAPATPTVDTSALEQENAKLKREHEVLKKQRDQNLELIQLAGDIEDCLMEVLSEIQDTNFDLLKEHLIRMRENYPEVFRKQMKNLDLDEGELGV